ncbi:MAG TPA: SAM-dependent methyltransferase [Vicinamibacterales bacterium]|jgi:SAM-dependent MidA family methyltransferase|nr:SAM-dependent methyltransferase [Vicinamibacterales bacterium]
MELALYDPAVGYYARAAQRSGRAGDFFTSVDVGPLFGELLATQIAEMATILQSTAEPAKHGEKEFTSANSAPSAVSAFDLVEAGAGNGRLSADILRAVRDRHPDLYPHVRLHLVEASAAARDAQLATLGDVRDRLSSAGGLLPESYEGVLVANELLDAFPVHQVVMRENGLKEVYVADAPEALRRASPELADMAVERRRERAALHTIEGPPSTPALQEYIDRLGITLEPGWRVEINLRAVDWIRDAAQRLARGFIILIDYGHEARDLYSASHAQGTLTTFSGHRTDVAQGAAPWLVHPGEQDITAHVDFTSVRDAAEAAGLTTIAFLDQTYFVLGLVSAWNGAALAERARALKTLLVPGGLGSTHKVMIFGKAVGTPALLACSFGTRVT